MARIAFDITRDPTLPACLWLVARPGWSWKDYHAAARVLSLSVGAGQQRAGPVERVIDLTPHDVAPFPSGFRAHVRTFATRATDAFTARAIVVGVPASVWATLGVPLDHPLMTPDGPVYGVLNPVDARALVVTWRAASA